MTLSGQLPSAGLITIRSMSNSSLIIAVAGIAASGVVGPAMSSWAIRRAAKQQFERDRAGQRRDDLAGLVDDAARLLSRGATNLRLAAEAAAAGQAPPPEIDEWLTEVFPLEQRLRLRRPADDPIVTGYQGVRARLIEAAQAGANTPEFDAAVSNFETVRDQFLDIAREQLVTPVTVGFLQRMRRPRS